jgi:hypothetical protein
MPQQSRALGRREADRMGSRLIDNSRRLGTGANDEHAAVDLEGRIATWRLEAENIRPATGEPPCPVVLVRVVDDNMRQSIERRVDRKIAKPEQEHHTGQRNIDRDQRAPMVLGQRHRSANDPVALELALFLDEERVVLALLKQPRYVHGRLFVALAEPETRTAI